MIKSGKVIFIQRIFSFPFHFQSFACAVSKKRQNPHPWGINPIWSLADNRQNFLHSFKMKFSFILGFCHSMLQLMMSLLTEIRRKNVISTLLRILPQLIFLSCTFGWGSFYTITWFSTTVAPRNNSLASKGSPSIKVNILRSQMIVLDVISPHFKGYPEIKVKNLQSQWDRWGGVLLYERREVRII